MFDFGFSELVIIAVVALVVVGPERLPTVARTVGALLGRLNRYVSDVKADVEREMRLEEMKKLRADVEQQALGIEQQVVRELEETRSAVSAPVAEATQSLDGMMQDTAREFSELSDGGAKHDVQKNVGSAAPALSADADSARQTELADAPARDVAPSGSSTPSTEFASKDSVSKDAPSKA